MCLKIYETKYIRTLEAKAIHEFAYQTTRIGHNALVFFHDYAPGCIVDLILGEEEEFNYTPITVKDHLWHPHLPHLKS